MVSPLAADRFCLFPKHSGGQLVLGQIPLKKLEMYSLICSQLAGGEFYLAVVLAAAKGAGFVICHP